MKTTVCGYVPPPTFPGANAFLENVSRNKIAGDYFFMSDHKDYGFEPGNILMYPPECHDAVKEKKTPRLSNFVFLNCLSKAALRGYTHMLYVESDCRFQGHGWDAILFEEYFSLPFPAIAAGSVVAHCMVNGGGEFYRRFTQYFNRNTGAGRKGIPIPSYGIPAVFKDMSLPSVIEPCENREMLRNFKPALYPNGAIGIYDVQWLCEIFGLNPDGSFKPNFSAMLVVSWPAWDHVIGWALYDKFGADVFEVVAHLDNSYSSYGDMLNTEAERMQMLRDKRVHAVHQVKSEVTE